MERYHPFRSQAAKEIYLAHYDAWAKQWPEPSETKFVETSFGKTFVRICPPSSVNRELPPLVLLPGDGETSLAWIQMLRAGLATDLRIFAVDHIYDNGRSVFCRCPTKPTDFVLWLDELVTAFLAMENNRFTKLNLMGHSYGGWQMALYSAAHPERVNKLALLAPIGVIRPRLQVLIRGMLYYFFPARPIVRQYLYWYAPICIQKDDTRQVVDKMVEETVLSFQCFKRRSFIPPTLLTEQNCWKAAKHVTTLVFVGDHEVTYSPEKAIMHLSGVAPQVTAMRVANADHHLALAQPENMANAVLRFFKTEHQQA